MRAAWRIGLALFYPLATVLALVGHDHSPFAMAHGGCHEHEAPAALDSCASGGVHLADHPDAPDLSGPGTVCIGCLFTSQHLAFLATPAVAHAAIVSSLAHGLTVVSPGPRLLRATVRGPPLV